jgi:hypothetical protein
LLHRLILEQKLKGVWEKRFGEEPKVGDCFHLMEVESVLHSSDIGEVKNISPQKSFEAEKKEQHISIFLSRE